MRQSISAEASGTRAVSILDSFRSERNRTLIRIIAISCINFFLFKTAAAVCLTATEPKIIELNTPVFTVCAKEAKKKGVSDQTF